MQLSALLLLVLVAPSSAFVALANVRAPTSARAAVSMLAVTEGVEFDTIAREWRMKWSGDDDKASLQGAQKTLTEMISTIKAVPGVKSVQRVVCGGCLDFKVITALSADAFGAWEAAG